MLIIPAIDLKDGHCVRLKQGVMEDSTVFSEDPAATAQHWLAQGARRLHLVDLNGAFAGKPKNEAAVRSIINAVGTDVPVQLGGGIRDLETIERYLDLGVTYIIVGTAAVKVPGFLHEACDAFPGHIMVGLDAKGGKVVCFFQSAQKFSTRYATFGFSARGEPRRRSPVAGRLRAEGVDRRRRGKDRRAREESGELRTELAMPVDFTQTERRRDEPPFPGR